MADWYCDNTNGNDSTGSGTSVSPYQTLQKAIDSATSGDNIFIANTSAQTLSSALTWNTGYTDTGTNAQAYTVIQGWDNSGSLTVNRASQTIPAGKIDASGLSVDWCNGSTSPFYLKFKNLIVDSSNTFTSYNARGVHQWANSEFIASTKTSGYHISFGLGLFGCSFKTFGASSCSNIFFNNFLDSQGYAIYLSAAVIVGNLVTCRTTPSVVGPLVQPGTNCVIAGNTFLANSALQNYCVLLGHAYAVFNNVFQGASHSSAGGINLNSVHTMIGANGFYDNTSNYANDSNATRIADDVIGTSALVTDEGTNEFVASNELKNLGFPFGFLSTDTLSNIDIGSIQNLTAAGGLLRVNLNGGM